MEGGKGAYTVTIMEAGLRSGPGLKKWWAGKSEVGGFRGALD